MKIKKAAMSVFLSFAVLLSSFGSLQVLADSGVGSMQWQVAQSQMDEPPLFGCTFGADKYVAVGIHRIDHSADGSVWNPVTNLPAGLEWMLSGITYAQNKYVAVGINEDGMGDNGFGYNGIVLTSSDGTDWSNPPVDMTPNLQLKGVAYGNNTIVAVGYINMEGLTEGVVKYSKDGGQTWQQVTFPIQEASNGLNGVTFGNGYFVAVGYNGTIMTSTNGSDWAPQPSGTTQNLNAVAYGNNSFVAVGEGVVLTGDATGTTWQQAPMQSNVRLSGVVYGNNTFVAVGMTQSENGIIMASADGSDWVQQAAGQTDQVLYGVCYGNNRFVTVGNNGEILYTEASEVTPTPVPLPEPIVYCHVTYNGNGSTGGIVPVDNSSYTLGDRVTVLGNTGTLVKDSSAFVGWNTRADGMGTDYAANSTMIMPSTDVTLYAMWTPSPKPAPKPFSAHVSYTSHVQKQGWLPYVSDGALSGTTGQSLRLEALKVKLTGNLPEGASIIYQSYVQKMGWQSAVSDDATSGTQGKSLRVEAFRVTIKGLEGHQVKYRAYVQGKGWMDWQTTQNGTDINDAAIAGTTGKALRVEAIEITIE